MKKCLDKLLYVVINYLLMDNTATALEKYDYLPPAFANNIGKGRPKGSRNKKTVLLESYIVPEIVKRLESIPQAIRDKFKDAVSWDNLNTMQDCVQRVDPIEKPETKFNMAARLYDLTTPRQQNIQVESRSTVIRSQDMLEGLKLLKSRDNPDGVPND